jgi:hypothetical protein
MFAKLFRIITAVFAVGIFGQVWATPIAYYVSSSCNPEYAQLTSIKEVSAAANPADGVVLSGELLVNGPYDATSCLVFDGNDDPSDPVINIGQNGDGLLNTTYGPGDSLFFIEPDELQNLDDMPFGVADDPGWIQLADVDQDLNVNYDQSGPVVPDGLFLDIDALLDMSFTCVGGNLGDCTEVEWVIQTDPYIIEQVQQLLGEATFDHLAFSIKVGDSFIIYDFDFVDIFDTEPGLNFLTPYQLSGSLYTGDFLNRNNNPQGISHLSVWARDPADSSVVVSEPSTLGIIILAIFGGVISRLSRRRL